jgi:hypothetical protein
MSLLLTLTHDGQMVNRYEASNRGVFDESQIVCVNTPPAPDE